MDLWTAIKVVLRRWYLVVPAIIITIVVAGLATSRLTPVYSASGSVMFSASNQRFYPTDDDERVESVNPLEEFTQSLQTTAQLVGDKLNSDEVRERFKKEGLNSTYKVAAPYDPTRTVLAPTVEFSVEDTDPDVVLDTINALQAEAKTQLDALQTQAGARPELFIQSRPLITPVDATREDGMKLRVAGIVVLLGLALALSLAFMAESVISSRSTRRAAEDRAARRITPDGTRPARPSRAASRGAGGTRPARTR